MFPHQNLPFLLKILRGKYAARMAWTAESPTMSLPAKFIHLSHA